MTEFNWTVDDIKRAQRDFSNNFMRLDCIRTESYDVAIDCMTKCIEKKATDAHPVKWGHWYHNTSRYVSELDAYFIQACCSCCGRYSDRIDQYSQIMSNETCSHCGAEMRGENND